MSRAPRPGRPPLWLLGLVLGFLVALWVLREALMPFFVAMVLAYLLLPLVERLARELACDLAFLPDPACERTAPMACERLAAQGKVALLPRLASKENRHG